MVILVTYRFKDLDNCSYKWSVDVFVDIASFRTYNLDGRKVKIVDFGLTGKVKVKVKGSYLRHVYVFTDDEGIFSAKCLSVTGNI